MTCCRERSQERQCCWNTSLELSLTSMESRQSPSNLNICTNTAKIQTCFTQFPLKRNHIYFRHAAVGFIFPSLYWKNTYTFNSDWYHWSDTNYQFKSILCCVCVCMCVWWRSFTYHNFTFIAYSWGVNLSSKWETLPCAECVNILHCCAFLLTKCKWTAHALLNLVYRTYKYSCVNI